MKGEGRKKQTRKQV